MAMGFASLAIALPRTSRAIVCAGALGLTAVALGAEARDQRLAAPLVDALGPFLDDRFAPPVWLEGRIVDDASVSGGAALVSIEVSRLRTTDTWRVTSGRATLAIGGESAATSIERWTRGRVLTAPVLVRRPQMWRNFGGAGERWQRLRQTSDVTGSVKSAALVDVAPASRLAELGAAVRRRVRHDITDVLGPHRAESAGVIIAILIGDRSSLGAATTKSLQRAGTYHVIAISGGNIAIVVATCLLALRLVLRSRRVIALLTMAVVLAYGGVVGDQASVERAVAAAIIVLGVQAAGWCVPAWRVLLLAALAVLLVDPLTAVDAGAWLSFGATLGILLFARPIAAAVTGRLGGARSRVADLIITMCAATAAAELALVPISAAVFSQVSLAGFALNLIAIPAMAVVQFAGLAILFVARVAPWAADLAGLVGHWGVIAILRSADLLTFTPWLAWATPPPRLGWAPWTLAYYAALAMTLAARWRRPARWVAGVSLIAIAGSPLWPPGGGPPPGWLRVTFLDVGQGDGILAQFPTGQSLVVDTGGSATGFDIGARVVRPALWALGVRRPDYLAVTHGDIDHAGGALSLLDEMRPREVWEGVPVPSNAAMSRLRVSAHDRGVTWARLAAGQSFEFGSVGIQVINPPVPDWERRVTRNDDSLVLSVTFGDVGVLLTGDISTAVEEALPMDVLMAPGQPRLRLLKAAHHGSRTSSSEALIGRWLPQAVLISVGRGNTFGHPAAEVLARYDQQGVDVFRTDRDGAISLETDGRVVIVRTARGRTWRLSAVGR
jgi:competence protein ComEC